MAPSDTRPGVYWDENGALQSACSCPYGEKCKHAVATILTYAKMKAADQVVPKTRRNDKRLRLSAVASMGEMDFDFGAANLDVSASTKTPPTDPRAFMQSLPAERLLALLEELMESIPEAARYLESVMMRDSRDTSALLAALRKEMVRVCGEAEDWEPGGRYGTPAGFDHVRELMENLIAAGGVDELAEYGELFMQQVSDLVAEYHYHDDLRAGAEDCVPLVLKAVKKSSMSPTWRLIWALDILLDDEYEMAGVIGRLCRRTPPQGSVECRGGTPVGSPGGVAEGVGEKIFAPQPYRLDHHGPGTFAARERDHRSPRTGGPNIRALGPPGGTSDRRRTRCRRRGPDPQGHCRHR